MFLTESVTLSTCGIQFQLPPHFTILSPQELTVDSQLILQSPAEDYTILLSLTHSELPSRLELQDIFAEGGYQLLTPIAPFARNQLCGHSAAYLSGKQGYWELRLNLPTSSSDSGAPNTLVIQLSTHWGRGILSLIDAPPLQFLLHSIRPISQ